MKTFHVVLWTLAVLAVVGYVVLRRLSLTFTSDIPVARQALQLPKTLKVYDLLSATTGSETLALRVRVGL